MSETTFTASNGVAIESQVFGVSVRAWLALILVAGVVMTHVTVCIAISIYAVRTRDFQLVGTLTTIGEPFYSLAIAAVAYYFGSKNKT